MQAAPPFKLPSQDSIERIRGHANSLPFPLAIECFSDVIAVGVLADAETLTTDPRRQMAPVSPPRSPVSSWGRRQRTVRHEVDRQPRSPAYDPS